MLERTDLTPRFEIREEGKPGTFLAYA
jgi:hypothetical protein